MRAPVVEAQISYNFIYFWLPAIRVRQVKIYHFSENLGVNLPKKEGTGLGPAPNLGKSSNEKP